MKQPLKKNFEPTLANSNIKNNPSKWKKKENNKKNFNEFNCMKDIF